MLKFHIAFLLIICDVCNSARILGAVFTPSYSHQLAFQPIWKELSLRGHQLTVLTTNPINNSKLTNLTEIDLSMSYEITKLYKTDELLSTKKGSTIERLKQYMKALHEVADMQLSHPTVQDLIDNHRNDFDLLLVEAIYPTQMALAWWFQVPFIGLVSLDAPNRLHAVMGNPVHSVLYPAYDLPFDQHLSFSERLASSIHSLFMLWYEKFKLHPREDETIRKYFGANAPSIEEIQKNMSLLFINVNPVFHNIRPLGATTIPIGGGIHLKQTSQLPQDIQQYLDQSKTGFVYFSLGTNVKSAALQPEVKQAILEALSALPFNVLWKFEDENIPNKPKNIKIVSWVPQPAVLAHSNIKAFVTQGGIQSVEEAIHFKVPMLAIPFYGDQGHNSKIIERKEIGLRLQPEELNKEKFLEGILNVSTNARFKENVIKMSQLFKDEQVTGLEKAIWWTEYLLRHGTTHHLKTAGIDVPLYQIYYLDILLFVICLISIIIYTITSLIKCVCFEKKVKLE